MSNDDVRQTPRQTDGSTSTATVIEEFFNRIAGSGFQPRLRSVTGICQFDIAGADDWRVSVTNGMPTVTRTPAHETPADCVVMVEADDLARLIRGEGNLNVLAAWLQGLVTISGDITIAATLLGSYTLEPIGSQPR